MEYVSAFLVGTLISWIGLLIVIPIAQKLADFSMPEWSERLWKLAVVAAAGNATAIALDPINFWLSMIIGAIVFWLLMVRWFQIDLFGAFIIMIVTWVVRAFLIGIVIGMIG